MSREYREPVDRESYLVCDICGGEIKDSAHVGHPDDLDVHFHEGCRANAPEWVDYAPSDLFNGETSYGEYVEAVRNGKCILFVDGEDRYPTICDDREDAERCLEEMDMAEEVITGIVINGEFHEAYTVVKLHIDGIDDED
jgi:hypothetical protein